MTLVIVKATSINVEMRSMSAFIERTTALIERS
jgi:hypothetical protein